MALLPPQGLYNYTLPGIAADSGATNINPYPIGTGTSLQDAYNYWRSQSPDTTVTLNQFSPKMLSPDQLTHLSLAEYPPELTSGPALRDYYSGIANPIWANRSRIASRTGGTPVDPETVPGAPQANSTTPLSNMGSAQPQSTPAASSPAAGNSAVGVNPSPGTPGAEFTLPSYDDEAFQNLPFLRYLRGEIPWETFNTLANTNVAGPFGTLLPQAGGMNLARIMEIARDPVEWGNLQSLYQASNRDLGSEVARAQTRAPVGYAVPTSAVWT